MSAALILAILKLAIDGGMQIYKVIAAKDKVDLMSTDERADFLNQVKADTKDDLDRWDAIAKGEG